MASLGTRPVVSVIPSTKRKEAVEITNSSPLSLDAAVFTDSYDHALSLADELEADTVQINGAPRQGFGDIPFGGHQNSGIGREDFILQFMNCFAQRASFYRTTIPLNLELLP